MSILVSIDPGKNKCGLLLADVKRGIVLNGLVIAREMVLDVLSDWNKNYSIDLILLGNGTFSDYWKKKLIAKNFSSILIVDEIGSTLRARERYWELWPPNCFFRLLPRTLLFPPKNLDAIASLILLEDYLSIKLNWPNTNRVIFKT